MDIDGVNEEENSRRVQVRFVTKLKPPMTVPPLPIAIPSNLTRLGLSTLVNNLIQNGNPDWNTQPFDFLIDGELVRMSLDKFLLAKSISAEKILEIEYIKAVAPRKEEEPSLHDDWVSSVDGSDPRFIVTGCYDSLARVWKAAGECTHILEGHSDVIASVSVINRKGVEGITVATASKDRTLRLWKFDTEDSINNPIRIRAFKILRGHTKYVQCVAAQNTGDMVCSGSWDSTIKLWQTNDSQSDGDLVSIKKRKGNDQADESQLEGEAVSTLVGHTQCVSSVVWPQQETIYSASWDHSVRLWDAETGKNSSDIFCMKVLNCLDVGGESSALVAAGGSDPILRIWDPRKPGTSAPVFQFSSHTSWISACKWHDKSWFHLVSSSYDGKVMLWDLRTAWPLAVIESHKDKVLCADWWKGDSIISGGADSKLCVSSGISVLRFIVTGCYDSLARVWKAAGECTHILEGHSDVIASVGVINRKGVEGIIVATASKDRTLRLWKFDTEDSINNPIRIRAFKILRGHTKSVQCVAAQNTGDMVCSGSWDSMIKLWQTNDSQSDGDLVPIKKRKGNNQADESQLEGEAVSTLVGRTQCVSSVVWPQQETIYSASWDHSVRLWDAETGKNSSDIFCMKVLNCLDVGGESSALIAAGGSVPILRIWDPRKPGTSAPVFQFSFHTSWISACKWHDESWFHLVSSSYDGKIMLWDLRTAWPLAVIESHKDKVLCADWWKGDSIISGGADSKLCVSSGISVL